MACKLLEKQVIPAIIIFLKFLFFSICQLFKKS